jgi:hypothetical protein
MALAGHPLPVALSLSVASTGHYAPRVQVQDDSDEQSTFASPHVSEVGCPFLVRACRSRVPVQQILRNGMDWFSQEFPWREVLSSSSTSVRGRATANYVRTIANSLRSFLRHRKVF